MNVVDTSGWLEYFANSPSADFFSRAIENTAALIVPTICLYEVAKIVRRQRGNQLADESVALMTQGRVVDLTAELALHASTFQLPLADSIIYSTARRHKATLWTQDTHFQTLPGVKFQEKR